MLNGLRRSGVTTCVALLLGTTLMSGCIGRMALSAKVRKWNLEVVSGKWEREAVFLLLYFIPVYPFAGGLDLVIFNSIEFHTGTNPLDGQPRIARVGEERFEVAADGSRVVSTLQGDGSIDVEMTGPDGSVGWVNILPADDALVARDASGDVLGRVLADGTAESAPRL